MSGVHVDLRGWLELVGAIITALISWLGGRTNGKSK